jgi:hypothetical protein
LQYATHALAPDCLISRTETGKTYTCKGARGSATVEVGPDDRLIHLHLQLVRMELFNAKVLLEPPLTPIIGKATVDAMEVELAKLQHAQRGALDGGGAHVAVFAGGTNLREPEYEVDVTW